ncbi:hypothetical protein [Parasitella parasitica]|uniref:Uncharacterized protein n=1 Tax=Parasitella parasitica TaxID=35722 RepID=A0A0B7MYJ2_9FUNG|nr:hypothetical protein [Parasitella parasitica]
MPSSPLRQGSEPTLSRESPSRFQNRFAERYKSALESPPREISSSSFTAKGSPLRSNQGSQPKILDNEKYTSFEISNGDRGEWREIARKEDISVKEEVDLVKVSASPVRRRSPPPKPSLEMHSSATPPREQEQYQVNKPHRVPHYMQNTKSFQKRVTAKKEERQTDNVLRPRSKGGITKRVSTSKVPRYQSTTSINAVDDIRSEMAPDEVYVPLAARIKLFEKGLGNGSNKPAPVVPKYTQSNSKNSHSPTPSISNSSRPGSANAHRCAPTQSEKTDSTPSYLRQTSSSSIKKKEHHASKSASPQVQPSTLRKKRDVQPFHFATSKRAEHYDSTFKDKLNLWKVKDKEATENDIKNRGIKRKNTTPTDISQKHTKYNT